MGSTLEDMIMESKYIMANFSDSVTCNETSHYIRYVYVCIMLHFITKRNIIKHGTTLQNIYINFNYCYTKPQIRSFVFMSVKFQDS